MYIVSTEKMLIDAKKNKYAIPAFNVYNLETLKGVVEGASEMKSPVILATTPSTIKYTGLEFIVSMADTAAKKYNIPIALHLDHCTDIDFIKKCILAGYKSVMIDASAKKYDENISITKEIVEFAKKYDVKVEAELGHVASQEEINIKNKDSMFTDPDIAVEFVNETNIDSLAIAIGTVHGVYKMEPDLDFLRLKEIREKINIPLVLHGASGVGDKDIKMAIEYGINKINIATELKIPFTKVIRDYLNENPKENDLRYYLAPGKDAIKEVVKKKIELCGSNNKVQ